MFAALYADGRLLDSDGETESVTVELNSDGDTAWRCRACGEDVTETAEGYATETDELVCWAYEPPADALPGPDFGDGPHDPERIPLSWCNAAGISVDPCADSVTVSLSVGDPRGAFTFTLSRIADDAPGDLAGRIVLHVPYPGEPLPHMPLAAVRPGTYLVGGQIGAQSRPTAARCAA